MRRGHIITCDRRHFIVDNIHKFEAFKKRQSAALLLEPDERELADKMSKNSKNIGLVPCDQDGRKLKSRGKLSSLSRI